ncbi:MAG: NAD(P)H-dependent oxidoreductase [Myxococcota bacterium]|jgi:putative NADPH-quinone reductase|nr:NAD(P)H-dependent oxidoreductase [Myxococcota bacterium]
MMEESQSPNARITVFSSAPRPSGFTRELEDDFCAGVQKAGGQCRIVRLPQMKIAECRGCYGCWNPTHRGQCALPEDDMSEARAALLDADAVVFSTPLYFFGIAASLKRFFERLLPLTEPSAAVGSFTGLTMNRPSALLRRRPVVLICTGAHRDKRIFDGVRSSFLLVADALNLEPAGILLRPETFLLDFQGSYPTLHRRVHAAFEDAGAQLVHDGRVTQQCEEQASQPLTKSQEIMDSHFATYWKIAQEQGLGPAQRRELCYLASRDMRILIQELASSYDSTFDSALRADIRFELAGADPDRYVLRIAEGQCHAVPDTGTPATLTISTSSELMADVLLRKIDMRMAYAQKLITVSGNRQLFTKMGKLFLASRK